MGLIGSLSNYFDAKAEVIRENRNLWCYYSILARIIYEILLEIERPYLEKNFTFDELVYSFHNSTPKQYIYSLKYNRKVTSDDIEALERALFRGMSSHLGLSTTDFKKSYKVRIVNDELFVELK